MSIDEMEPAREEVLALFGETMLAVQQLEEAMVGMLGVRKELPVVTQPDSEPTAEHMDELEQLWEELFTQTAGQLSHALKFEGQLGEVDVSAYRHPRAHGRA